METIVDLVMENVTATIVIGSIAAIGTCITATIHYKNRKDSKRQVKFSVKPDLWLDGAGYRYDGRVHIDLRNKGERARITEFRLVSGNIRLQALNRPYDLEKDEFRYIHGQIIDGSDPKMIEYTVDVFYKDKHDNRYKSRIKVKGDRALLDELEEL